MFCTFEGCLVILYLFGTLNVIRLVGYDFVVSGLKIVKTFKTSQFDCEAEVYIDEVRIKWHNIIRLISYQKPIRIKFRSIDVKVNVTNSVEFVPQTPKSTTKNANFSKFLSSFECQKLKIAINYTARKAHSNLPNQNHTTQIELDQSEAFMVQSKGLQNNVFQVEKVTVTTTLEHQS